MLVVPKIKNLDLPIETKSDDGSVEDGEHSDVESKDVKMHVLKKLVEDDKFALTAIDGFLLVLNSDGDITYVSEDIADYLGLAKVIFFI